MNEQTNEHQAVVAATSSIGRVKPVPSDDPHYDGFLAQVSGRGQASDAAGCRLFTTDAEGLWEAYLEGSPSDEEKKHRTCHTCKSFIERFGGLVTLNADGEMVPAFWDEHAPPGYAAASYNLAKIVRRARVAGVFLTSESVLGTPSSEIWKPGSLSTGVWKHLAARTPKTSFWLSKLTTASQHAALKREEHGMLTRSLAEFKVETVRQAALMLTTESLPRSEKHVELAKWLVALYDRRAATHHELRRENMVWYAAATAPPGWAHVRSGLLGTLLADIESGMGFDEVKRRFAEKIDPLAYMRPQAPPKAGNIAAAEKAFETLRSSGALERRFAKLSDVQTIWKPSAPAAPAKSKEPARAGVFDHLRPKPTEATPARLSMGGGAPAVVMTWVKFRQKVLPLAERIELLIPEVSDVFTAYVTATNSEAPPILQWDRAEARNPVSWYVYAFARPASQWGLRGGVFTRLTAVCEQPTLWDGSGRYTHHGESVCLVVEGAKDGGNPGLALFPECLRSEYHGYRSVLEAHSARSKLTGYEEAEVCGVRVEKNKSCGHMLRVRSLGTEVVYKIDRWD